MSINLCPRTIYKSPDHRTKLKYTSSANLSGNGSHLANVLLIHEDQSFLPCLVLILGSAELLELVMATLVGGIKAKVVEGNVATYAMVTFLEAATCSASTAVLRTVMSLSVSDFLCSTFMSPPAY